MGPCDVHDEVVALAAFGEILARVVDDAVRADRPEHVELPGCIYRGHLCPVRLRELHREGPHRSAGAVDHDRLSRSGPALIANGLHRERSGRRDGSGLFEGEVGGLQLEPGLRSGRVVRIGAAVAPQIGTECLTEDLIARPESRDVPADRLDMAGHVRSRNVVLRRAET
jgi:hypothetical protein